MKLARKLSVPLGLVEVQTESQELGRPQHRDDENALLVESVDHDGAMEDDGDAGGVELAASVFLCNDDVVRKKQLVAVAYGVSRCVVLESQCKFVGVAGLIDEPDLESGDADQKSNVNGSGPIGCRYFQYAG